MGRWFAGLLETKVTAIFLHILIVVLNSNENRVRKITLRYLLVAE